MGFLLVQGGSSLYKIDPSTGTATALTLPTGVTLSTTRKPRFAILNQFVAMVNSPSRNLIIDPEGTVRLMVPPAPAAAPVLASGGAGNVTGDVRLRCSFVTLGSDGQLYTETALSPVGNVVTLSSNSLAISRVPISTDSSISARRIYRNIAGGETFYKLLDVDGNTATTAVSNLTDALLELLPVDSGILVAPPGTLETGRMRIICSWKSRLWGVGSDPTQVDDVLFTESNKVYAWPNLIPAYPKGQNTEGIVAFAPRRDQLGVLKRDGLWQITGSASGSTGISTSSVSLVQIVYGKAGCIAPDSVVTVNDRVYWLGNDGVWEWGPEGVKNISNETVKPWFDKDSTYFNASRFPNAFAKFNEARNCYSLHLAANGSSVEDRWVEFNLTSRKWYGPHKTGAFTPSHAASGLDANGLPLTLVGGTDGVVYVANQATFRDGAATLIDMDCIGPFHSANAPDMDHHWGELSVLSKVESGGTLSVTPKVGRLNSAAQSAISHDLTKGREVLRIIGDGALCQLRFQQASLNQGATIYGYEIDNVFENGKK